MELEQAIKEVEILEVDYEGVDRPKMRAWLMKRGLPIEIVSRLDDLWDTTKVVAGRVLKVGKLIFLRILEFLKKYPHVGAGILIGAAVGALMNALPFLGPLLAPLSTAIGALVGGITGAEMDTEKKGMQAVIEVATEFFSMLIDLFRIIFSGVKNNECES